jgi:glycosyltransferase involved in cell wall biosynthesis
MRALVVSNLFPPSVRGGYELTCSAFVRRVRELGHEVRVITSDHPPTRPSSPAEARADIRRVLGWRDTNGPPSHAATLRGDRRDRRELLSQVAEFQPDAITVWGMNGLSRVLIPGLREAGVPISARVSDGWLNNLLRLSARTHRFGARRAVRGVLGVPVSSDLRHVDRWVFSSRHMLQSAVALGFDPSRTAVVHSGVDVDATARRPALPWGGRLLYLGRIEAYKGVDTAVRGAAEIDDASLRIVGSGEKAALDELSELVAALHLADRVEIRPAVDRLGVVAELQRADAVLFPSRWAEPWGKVPLEAMAAGVPVVASGTGGSAEYLCHGQNALVAPADDHAGWTAAIRRLAASDRLRARLREGGFVTADRYSERRANEGLLRELLGLSDASAVAV